MEPEELLYELKSCGLNISSGESVELYKDEEFSEALMIEHLRKLLQFNQLSNDPVRSETYLLNAEKLISDAIGTDNEYSKTAYHYLYSLYSRWQKNDRALEYKDKILGLRLS